VATHLQDVLLGLHQCLLCLRVLGSQCLDVSFCRVGSLNLHNNKLAL
jgi:hypothetical protein